MIYERKLQRTNDLYIELSSCFAQLEEREREIAEREKQIGTNKPYRKAISQLRKQHFDKISRRRLHMAAQFTQANIVNNNNNGNGNSPSPPGSPMKTSVYVQLDGNTTKTVLQTPIGYSTKKKSRHRRVGSGSSMKNIINRDRKQFESAARDVVDTHTQTEELGMVEEDNTSASSSKTNSTVKKNQDSDDSSNESDIDDNVPQEDTTSSSQTNNLAMANSMATSIMTGSNLSYDTEDLCEKHRVTSDDDNLESLRRKVNELIIETASNIDSYSTNSSANTIINKIYSKRHSRNCEKSNEGVSCLDHAMPSTDFVDNNKNIKSVKCSCVDEDADKCVDGSVDDDANSCSDDDFGAPKKFNYSLRMKR